MRAKEFLKESFDQPYPIQWDKGEFGDIDAVANLDDGSHLHIMFNHEGAEEWQVEFYRDNSQAVTGKGDAHRVFATVLSSIQTFIQKEFPQRIVFSATKEVEPGQNSQSRAKLYNSLVTRYARAWGYTNYTEDQGNLVTYDLVRNEENLAEEVTPAELAEVEKLVDSLWNKMGIDVSFTRHFLDRVNDTRNGKDITVEELARLFIEEYKKYGLKIRDLDNNDEAVFKDLATDINLPFVIKSHGYESELIAKTVMRKKNFGTPNPVFPVASTVSEARLDPEFLATMKLAKAKYPMYDEETALLKYLQRSSRHGEETDAREDSAINSLSKEVADIKSRVARLEKR